MQGMSSAPRPMADALSRLIAKVPGGLDKRLSDSQRLRALVLRALTGGRLVPLPLLKDLIAVRRGDPSPGEFGLRGSVLVLTCSSPALATRLKMANTALLHKIQAEDPMIRLVRIRMERPGETIPVDDLVRQRLAPRTPPSPEARQRLMAALGRGQRQTPASKQ